MRGRDSRPYDREGARAARLSRYHRHRKGGRPRQARLREDERCPSRGRLLQPRQHEGRVLRKRQQAHEGVLQAQGRAPCRNGQGDSGEERIRGRGHRGALQARGRERGGCRDNRRGKAWGDRAVCQDQLRSAFLPRHGRDRSESGPCLSAIRPRRRRGEASDGDLFSGSCGPWRGPDKHGQYRLRPLHKRGGCL